MIGDAQDPLTWLLAAQPSSRAFSTRFRASGHSIPDWQGHATTGTTA